MKYFFRNTSNALDTYIKIYDKFFIAGDFNTEVSEPKMENSLGTHGLASLIHGKTCFISSTNPARIDLTNSRNPFNKFYCDVSRHIRFS